MPKASIILPTYNRLNLLSRVLAALERQTYPREDWDVIVVSDGCTDGTDEYLQSFQTPLALKTVFQANSGAASARNSGIAIAYGEIIIFLDDDVIPAPEFVEEHLRSHAGKHSNNVVIGPMLPPPDHPVLPWVKWNQERLVEQYRDMIDGNWAPTPRQFYTGNCSIARCHLVEAGGFDTTFHRAEDVELAYRLGDRGLCFVFNPQAAGYHYEERNFEAWKSISYTYGRNDVIFTYQKGQTWLLETVFREYRTRHVFIQGAIDLCLDRKAFRETFTAMMKGAIKIGHRTQLSSLVRLGCSVVSNLVYYQGVADELGGRKRFFTLLGQSG